MTARVIKSLKSLYYALYRSFVSSLTANPFWYSQGWVILARCVFEGILTVCLRQPSCSALLPSTAPAPPNGWRNVALATVELSPGITVWGVIMLHGNSSVFWFNYVRLWQQKTIFSGEWYFSGDICRFSMMSKVCKPANSQFSEIDTCLVKLVVIKRNMSIVNIRI